MPLLFIASIGPAGRATLLGAAGLGAAASGGHAALIATLAAACVALWVTTPRQDRH
ncbi:MAG: hypothetical protein RL341_354 [Pseudomonadota bacterium]|jgi:hypothetical protein